MLLAAIALSVSGPATGCTLADAIPASVREMARHPDEWLGRCVRVEGFARWNNFYADVAGAYAAQAEDRVERNNDGWLGLYLHGQPSRELRRGTVWGVLADCGRNYEAETAAAPPNSIVMSIGYCHNRGGLILIPASFRPSAATYFERQTGEAERARFGDLLRATPDHGPPDEVVRLAEGFVSSLRSGNLETMGRLVGPWSEVIEGPEVRARFVAYALGEGDSPFAVLRNAALEPRPAFFVERRTADAVEFGYAQIWHICFCRLRDCEGRWPISSFDAVALSTRPYACLRAINAESLQDPPDQLALERRDSGFREPTR